MRDYSFNGPDANLEISIREYGLTYRLDSVDAQEYDVYIGVDVDDNCNFTRFVETSFNIDDYISDIENGTSWINPSDLAIGIETNKDLLKYAKEAPLSFMEDVIRAYNWQNFAIAYYDSDFISVDDLLKEVTEYNNSILVPAA